MLRLGRSRNEKFAIVPKLVEPACDVRGLRMTVLEMPA